MRFYYGLWIGLISLKVAEYIHSVIPPFKWNDEDRWHWSFGKRFFHHSNDMQGGGDWWHTYLVPGSITVVMFPLPIKCIWFPAEGVAGRAEIWQQRQGQGGSSRKHHFHWCAWKRRKSGNAYTIRAETLSDLIFERGLSRGPQRVLLIHCPGPLCGVIERLYSGGWRSERSFKAPSLKLLNEFSHQSQENYLKSLGWLIGWWSSPNLDLVMLL